MKVILELEGVGYVAVHSHGWTVFDKWIEVKKDGVVTGDKTPSNSKHFGTLRGAIEELREVFQAKKIMKGEPAKSLKELMERIDKANEEWKKFYDEHQIGNMGKQEVA
jgi:hypothetical protein